MRRHEVVFYFSNYVEHWAPLPEAGTDSSSSSTAPQEHPGIYSLVTFLWHELHMTNAAAVIKQLQPLQRSSSAILGSRVSLLLQLRAAAAQCSQRQCSA
jgi:hypothetical protein